MSCRPRFPRILVLVCAFWALPIPSRAADQHWTRVSSDHFAVLTDAGDRRGHEVAARFEQMRTIFGELLVRKKLRMSGPLEIIAIGNDSNYAQLAPVVNGQPTKTPAFFLPGEDRIFIVLDLFEPDSWRSIEHQFAHYMLNYNYPPTPPWFDEGFAEYFGSLSLSGKDAELGSDPELHPAYQTDLLGNETETNSPKSLTEILGNPVWLNWADLLTMKNRVVNGREGSHHTLFYAQSWILVHYLLNKNKLPETGKYFDLVENQRIPVEQAAQQAFGMTLAQLDREVKDYFHSLKPLFDALDASKQTDSDAGPTFVYHIPLPFSLDDVATSAKSIPLPEALALVDEMELRIPERRAQAIANLQKLISDDKSETVVAHRALAWAYVQQGDTNHAFDELNAAMQINASDPWTRFGLALASYHSGEKGARVQGLANMMESLHIVIEQHPDFAEAYNMLGWARLTGGGANAALESMKMAVQLSPRNEEYQLRLARAYLAAKQFDEATGTLDRLKLSQDPQVAQAAKKDLDDLPFLKKYGVPPAEEERSKVNPAASKESDSDEDNDESSPKPASTASEDDQRPVKFLKATLLSIDCSKPPAAVLTISQGRKILKLRAQDYKSVPVIGAGDFSCGWKSIAVNINYRAGGKSDGELVSIEIPEPGR